MAEHLQVFMGLPRNGGSRLLGFLLSVARTACRPLLALLGFLLFALANLFEQPGFLTKVEARPPFVSTSGVVVAALAWMNMPAAAPATLQARTLMSNIGYLHCLRNMLAVYARVICGHGFGHRTALNYCTDHLSEDYMSLAGKKNCQKSIEIWYMFCSNG